MRGKYFILDTSGSKFLVRLLDIDKAWAVGLYILKFQKYTTGKDMYVLHSDDKLYPQSYKLHSFDSHEECERYKYFEELVL